MIIQIGTEVDESRILWKHNEKDEWKRADIDELIDSYESIVRCKDCRYFKKIAERSDSGLCHRDIVASAWKENGYCSRGERKGGAE